MKFYLALLITSFATSTTAVAQLDLIDDTKTRGTASETTMDASDLGLLLDKFHAECGRYPTTKEGLDALVKKPKTLYCKNWQQYATSVPKTWIYKSKNDDHSYELKKKEEVHRRGN